MFDRIYIFALTFWFSNAVTNTLRQHCNKGKWGKKANYFDGNCRNLHCNTVTRIELTEGIGRCRSH